MTGASMGREAALAIGTGFSMTAGGASEFAGVFFATAFFAATFLTATFFTPTFFAAFFAVFFAGAFFAALFRADFTIFSAVGISKRSSVVFLLIRKSIGKSDASIFAVGRRSRKREW